MNRRFRDMLEESKGVSEHVIAIVCDIRGFSSFSTTVDSADAGLYVRRIYTKLIDEYFNFASFFKPTGDGILAVIPYTDDDLKELATRVINSSLKLIRDFPDLCKGDPSIYFEVPRSIGIGIARGAACKIVSGDDTLDYSGKTFNFAARLMEYARPSGLVLDHTFGKGLIPKELGETFLEDSVFVRGIFDQTATQIYFTKGLTLIPDWAHSPLIEPQFKHQRFSETLSRLKSYRGAINLPLDRLVPNPEEISVILVCNRRIEGKGTIAMRYELLRKNHAYRLVAGKPCVIVDKTEIQEVVESWELVEETPLVLDVSYPLSRNGNQ